MFPAVVFLLCFVYFLIEQVTSQWNFCFYYIMNFGKQFVNPVQKGRDCLSSRSLKKLGRSMFPRTESWGFGCCCNYVVREICMLMSPKQHSWWGVVLQYWMMVRAIQLLSLFLPLVFFGIMWKLMWNYGAYHKKPTSCRRSNKVR